MLKIEFLEKDLKDHKLFFTSDLHFRHGNIIKFCNRPFSTVQEMDATLINNWNETVSVNDIVFILGDFAFAYKSKWRQLLNKLKGTKYLIIGNHDNEDEIPIECFKEVADLGKIFIEREDEIIDTFLLSHRPILSFEGMFDGRVKQLFGHVHSRENNTGNDAHLLKYLVNSYDVGVDNNNFRPISYDELKLILK